MWKRNLVSVLALSVFVVLATGSTPGALDSIKSAVEEGAGSADGAAPPSADNGGSGNAAACRAYVEHYNSLECFGGVTMDPETTCPDIIDSTPIDMGSYYNCMIEHTSCDGNLPKVDGIDSCEMPTP